MGYQPFFWSRKLNFFSIVEHCARDYNCTTLKLHIFNYNYHRKLKLGSIEFYDHTEQHTVRVDYLTESPLRYLISKKLRFLKRKKNP